MVEEKALNEGTAWRTMLLPEVGMAWISLTPRARTRLLNPRKLAIIPHG
jgi:hypothetical protein